MSFLSRPLAAEVAARLFQAAERLGESRTSARMRARLPEYPGHNESLTVATPVAPAGITVYRPAEGDAPAPGVHINLHGGGYVLGMTELDDPLCRVLAQDAGVAVLNVDYVVAPQNPFPDAIEQVYAVAQWAAGERERWDGRRLTIGGQSAGGGIAAGVARLALERGGPAFALQVLNYPPLDLTVPAGEKTSPIENPLLKPGMGEVFDTAYAPRPSMRAHRLVSPAGPADQAELTGIAPAVVVAAEYDILRAEAARYAQRLGRCGALVEYKEIADADHGYDNADDELARYAYQIIAAHIRAAIAPPAR